LPSKFTVHSLFHNFNTYTAVLIFTCSMRDLLCQISWSCIIMKYICLSLCSVKTHIQKFVNLHSKYTNVYRVFTLQNRIMSSVWPKNSCRNLLKKLDVLPPSCQYILSLKMFVVDNQKIFQTNFSVHGFVFAYC
jgi:hypothetical protein